MIYRQFIVIIAMNTFLYDGLDINKTKLTATTYTWLKSFSRFSVTALDNRFKLKTKILYVKTIQYSSYHFHFFKLLNLIYLLCSPSTHFFRRALLMAKKEEKNIKLSRWRVRYSLHWRAVYEDHLGLIVIWSFLVILKKKKSEKIFPKVRHCFLFKNSNFRL